MDNTRSNNLSGSTGGNSSTTTVVTTRVPGIDTAQVIPSRPDFVRENSSKPENMHVQRDRG